jgi:hypothetical protein
MVVVVPTWFASKFMNVFILPAALHDSPARYQSGFVSRGNTSQRDDDQLRVRENVF